jgi:glycosyltransferase involved in cell wall biosynthesis
MHILKIIHGYPPKYNAGSEVYSQSVVNELKKTEKVTVFTREENEYELDFRFRKETKDGVDFVFVNMARGKDGYNHPLLNERFAKLIDDIKPDIAHIGHLNHLSTGIVDELYKRNIPILYTLHDFWLMCPRGQFLQRNFDGKNLYKLCDGQEDNKCANACYKMYFSNNKSEKYYTFWVNKRMQDIRMIVDKIYLFHAPSKYLMNRFISDFNIPKNKIFYLDYGFPTHYLLPVEICKSEEFIFGYIGTHIPAKGINILINAFKNVKGKTRLKIFGREQGQNTLALKEMAKASKNPIEFCGEYINQNLAEVVFNNVHCIVVSSIWGENSPLVIHEAQSCKIPVITANFGGMKEYVADGINGLLFTHRDEESLREKLQFAVDNPKKMMGLGQRGYLYSYSGEIPNIIKHCEELKLKYKEIINNG